MAREADISSLGRGAAALSHTTQVRESTAMPLRGSPEPSAAKHLEQPQRRRSRDKMLNNEFRGQRHQGAVPDRDFDVDLMAKK